MFYIPGYDPFHPRRYRELYRSESRAQAAISGYQIGLKPKAKGGPYGWRVERETAEGQTRTQVDVLVWSDIVKESMATGIVATYGQMLKTAWTYIGSGALFRLMRLRKGPVIAALYPIVFLLVQLMLAALVFGGVWAAITR
ncbi:MAG: hypothetical protein L0H65_08890, partial [Pseudorhodobacter sp.]|nr:hypothetical protein [Pseudorhodobacter sp.]